MTHETPDLPDLAGVMAEVTRLEVLAATLDVRLDSSLGAGPDDEATLRSEGGAVIDLRQGVRV